MRNFKIFLWIFVIFLVQTVVLSPIHIFGAVPSAVLAFVMCVAILENEFRTAVIISGICAVVMGAIGGRNFTEITLFYAYSSIIVFAARKRPRYVGNFPKTIVWTFIMSAILEILLFVIREMTLDVSVIFSDALPTAVFNTVIAVILYPILKKTLYKEEKKKKLLIVSTHLCLWLRCSVTLPTCVPRLRVVASMLWSPLTTSRFPRTLLTRSLLAVPRAKRCKA